MSRDGKLSRRLDIKFSVDETKYRISAKSESRPHVLDWNRDGLNDLVLVLSDNQSSYDEETKQTTSRFAQRIFVDCDSKSRRQKINEGIVAKSRLPPTRVGIGGPDTAADLRVKLKHFEDPQLEKLAMQQMAAGATQSKHFEFVDFDRDGRFDIVFSNTDSEIRPGEPGSGKTWQNHKTSDVLYWMRNLTRTGEPRFAPPIKLYDVPGKWRVTSFTVADADNDEDMDILLSVNHRQEKNLPFVSELWLLKTE